MSAISFIQGTDGITIEASFSDSSGRVTVYLVLSETNRVKLAKLIGHTHKLECYSNHNDPTNVYCGYTEPVWFNPIPKG